MLDMLYISNSIAAGILQWDSGLISDRVRSSRSVLRGRGAAGVEAPFLGTGRVDSPSYYYHYPKRLDDALIECPPTHRVNNPSLQREWSQLIKAVEALDGFACIEYQLCCLKDNTDGAIFLLVYQPFKIREDILTFKSNVEICYFYMEVLS